YCSLIAQIKRFYFFDQGRIEPDRFCFKKFVGISVTDMNMTPEIIYFLRDLILKSIGDRIGQNHHRDTQRNRQRSEDYHKSGKTRTPAKADLLSNVPNTFHRNKDAI